MILFPLLPRLKGWDHSYLPIIVGDAPEGTMSLERLSDVGNLSMMIVVVAANIASDRRQAALTLVHYAVGTVLQTLIAPLVYDGVSIMVKANQLGFVLDQTGSLSAFWVSPEGRMITEVAIDRLGNNLINILAPIAQAAHVNGRIASRGVTAVMLDAIYRGCCRFERAVPFRLGIGWVEELLAAMGYVEQKKRRTVIVHPDDGPPVVLPVPLVCCVLSRTPTEHSCPSCPQYPDEMRERMTEDWLRSLNDADFMDEVGRSRVWRTG